MQNPNFEPTVDSDLEFNEYRSVSPTMPEGARPVVVQCEDHKNRVDQQKLDEHCHVRKNDKTRNKTVWRKLITVLVLCIFFMIGEIIGGILAHSISIQTDAAHMAADIAGFFFSIMAIYISSKGEFIRKYGTLTALNHQFKKIYPSAFR